MFPLKMSKVKRKRCLTDSPALVDFALARVNSVTNGHAGEVIWVIHITKELSSSAKKCFGLVEMTLGDS